MKYCSHCGGSVADDAAFCSSCGKSLNSSGAPGGFWKGVAASIVGVSALVGILWATTGSNSADRSPEAAAAPVASSEDSPAEPEEASAESERAASPNVHVEDVGLVGKLMGEKPRLMLTVPEGQRLDLELRSPLSTETAGSGDRFSATLVAPVLVDGHEALPRGSEVRGHVAHAKRSDKVKGVAELTLELDAIATPSGDELAVEAEAIRFEAKGTKKKDAAKIGGGAGVGALVGGLIGGKKGAAIGAGVGAGAGTGAVLATRGEEVVLGEGALMTTRLQTSLTVDAGEIESH